MTTVPRKRYKQLFVLLCILISTANSHRLLTRGQNVRFGLVKNASQTALEQSIRHLQGIFRTLAIYYMCGLSLEQVRKGNQLIDGVIHGIEDGNRLEPINPGEYKSFYSKWRLLDFFLA